VTATGNAEGVAAWRDPLGGPMTVAGTPHYTAHVTWTRRTSSSRDSRQRDAWAVRSVVLQQLNQPSNIL